MEPQRDNPLARFTAFWWGLGVISLFFVVLFLVRLVAGEDAGMDPLERAAAIKRYEKHAQVEESQKANLRWKVVEEGKALQIPPSAAFEMVGPGLVSGQPTKVEDATQWMPGQGDPPGAEGEIDLAAVDAMSPPAGTTPDAAVMAQGQATFALCMACHGADAKGVDNPANPPLAPPLAGSDWVNGPASNLIRVQLRGLTGPITVSGKEYNLPAPMAHLAYQTDEQIAAVLTYLRNSFGNSAPPVLPEQVKALRGEVGKPMLTQDDIIGLGEAQ